MRHLGDQSHTEILHRRLTYPIGVQHGGSHGIPIGLIVNLFINDIYLVRSTSTLGTLKNCRKKQKGIIYVKSSIGELPY